MAPMEMYDMGGQSHMVGSNGQNKIKLKTL